MATSPVTIKDIAEALGMAHTTVSRALNDHPQTSADTKQRVREAAEALGYVANAGARHMRNGSSKLIGFIVPDVQNEFFNAVARSLANQCATSGYQLTLGISEDDPEREHQYVRALRENRAEGLMIAPCGHSLPSTRALLAQVPHVQLLRFDSRLGKLAVTTDDIAGVSDAVDHLLSLGHRHIGYIGTPLTLSTGKARLNGYKAALTSHGIGYEEALVRIGPTLPAFGKSAAKDLLASNKQITAFMVASSRQLIGVLQALRDAGLSMPDDMSVIGYGDTEWFELATPSITGVALSVQEMSGQATALLFTSLTGKMAPVKGRASKHMFKPTLIVRGSTGPVPRRQKAAR